MHILECFQALEIPQTASEDEIKNAYRSLILKFHPDKNPNNPEAKTKFEAVREAYKKLKEVAKSVSQFREIANQKPHDNEETIHLTEEDSILLGRLASDTGLTMEYVAECFLSKNEDSRYYQLTSLRSYLRNYQEHKFPALSPNEALQTTEQECCNLRTAFELIHFKLMTLLEVKQMAEKERLILVDTPITRDTVGQTWAEKAFANLQSYRSTYTKVENKTTENKSFSQNGNSFFTPLPKKMRSVEITFPYFITSLAKAVKINPAVLFEYYVKSDRRFLCISSLQEYIKNFNHQEKPNLSLEEAYALSKQERINLSTGYPLIKHNFMTMDEVKKLTEEERLCLVETPVRQNADPLEKWSERAFRNLEAFRKDNCLSYKIKI